MHAEPFVFMGFTSAYDKARVVLFGAPFDGTTSYRPGARFAPARIRLESEGIETYSPYADDDLEDHALADGGDLSLPFGNPAATLDIIKQHTTQLIDDEKIPFMLGGEHLVTLGVVDALVKKHPDLHVIQLDAHADLRDDYLGEKRSHATVMRRVHDLLGDGRIHQLGIRSGTKDEFVFGRQHTDFHPFDFTSIKDVVNAIGDAPVYLTIDLDVLDPSIMSGTGTPEPGGVTYNALLDAFAAMQGLRFIGADIVELSPDYDPSGVSTAVACKTVREVAFLLATAPKR